MITVDLFSPPPVGVLAAATSWVESALLGNIATAVAVIAVASIGLLMLTGRLDIRRGLTVVIGCFTVFGASTIVSGLHSAVNGLGEPPAPASFAEVPRVTLPAPPPDVPAMSDPYAGAAVPKNR